MAVVAYHRVWVNLERLAERLSLHPAVVGKVNVGEVQAVLHGLGEILRTSSATEALCTIAAITERSGNFRGRTATELRTPAVAARAEH